MIQKSAVSSNEDRDQSVARSIRKLLGPRIKMLGALAATSLFGGLAEALFLVVVTRIGFAVTSGDETVEVFGSTRWSTTAALVGALALVAARVIFAVVAGKLSAAQTTLTIASVRERLTTSYLHARWDVQQGAGIGQLQELLTTFTAQVVVLLVALTNATVSVFNLVALLGLAVVVDPLSSLGVILVVAVLGSALRPVRSAIRRGAGRSAAIGSSFASSLSEVSDLGMEFQVFHVQDQAADRVRALINRHAEADRRLIFMRSLVPSIYAGLAFLAVLIALAAVAASDSAMIGSVGAVMLVMLRSLTYGQGLQTALAQISSSAPYLDRLHECLNTFDEGRRVDGAVPARSVGVLAFERVEFEYVPGIRVLEDIDFVIQPREVVGIVGPSGGGKSTLVQLMLGLREPTIGSITLDGTSLQSFDRSTLTRRMTFVPQDASLFNGTVEENVRFLRSGISDSDIEAACRAANLWADIEGFDEGLQRQVGDRGSQLSGGQRQRLCIARALVERPDVLVLDEPTSALDVKSEQLIRSTLEELSGRMTIVIIAHRLSTLDICDRIMVLQSGRITAFDSPDALEADSDFYREALAIAGMR